VNEVSNIVSMQNDAKAPGEDALGADTIKNFHSSDLTLLTNLYNKCLKFAIFPEIWKSSVIKIIYKGGSM
jgi:hypothetical protein